MAETVQEVMNPEVNAVDAGTSIENAAQVMRERGIGDILVTNGDRVQGIRPLRSWVTFAARMSW